MFFVARDIWYSKYLRMYNEEEDNRTKIKKN